MIIIGDKNIPYGTICKIETIDDIKNTKPNSIVLFDFNLDILKYTKQNDIKSAVVVNNIKDSIFCASFDAFYIIVPKNISKKIQKIADSYMFDSKILAMIEDENSIENIAKKQIDGVIYKNLIDE
jgi:hypothetical protein